MNRQKRSLKLRRCYRCVNSEDRHLYLYLYVLYLYLYVLYLYLYVLVCTCMYLYVIVCNCM